MKAAKVLSFVVVLGLLGAPLAAAEPSKPWLKGLTGVKVNISVSRELVDAGVAGAQLRTQTELQLRSAGLRVDPSLVEPNLYIEVTACQGPGTNAYAAYVSVSVMENAKVARNGQELSTMVWGPSQYVLYLVRDFDNEVSGIARGRIDEFLNDWLAANPR